VPLKVYDETICVLKSAVTNAKLGRGEELAALKRLDDQPRRMERYVTGPSLNEFVAAQRDQSYMLGGRSIYGWDAPPAIADNASGKPDTRERAPVPRSKAS
jgi:hypothetical protein